MKYLFLAISSFLTIVAQMVAGNNFVLFNFLDFSLILVAWCAIYRNKAQSLFVGSLTGLLLDAALGWPLGYNAFGRTLAAFIVGQSWQRFNTGEQHWVRYLILVAASCTSSMSMFILFWFLQRNTNMVFLGASMIQGLITAAVGVLVFAVFETFKRMQTNKAHIE